MLVDLSRKLYTVDKKEVRDVSGTEELRCPHCDGIVLENSKRKVPMTVRSILSATIQAMIRGDEKKSAKECENTFDLLTLIHGDPVVELKSDDVALLKERVVKIYGTLISGQIIKILETGINPFEPEKESEQVDGTQKSEEVNAEQTT